MEEATIKLNKLRQQKREYYYRNKDAIREKQKLYQATENGIESIKKAKAQYFQSKVKKANGGNATDAHKRAKNVYYQRQKLYLEANCIAHNHHKS